MRHIKAVILLCCLLPLVAGCARGLSAFNRGQKLEQQGKLDEAVMKYSEASAASPDVAEYRVRFLTVSTEAARVHYKKGENYLALKKYDDSLREFQAAFALDPSLDRAGQMVDQVTKLRNANIYLTQGEEFEKNRKPREALAAFRKALEIDSSNSDAKEGIERLLKTKKTKLDGFELNLKSTKPITLKFRDAKLKEVFNILSQLSGINFVFDEGLKDQNVTIMLENATFQQALEILCGINKLGKKVLNESTIILYPKNPEKNKQYEDLRVETFILNKLDAKKAVNLIRTMLPAKKIYVNEDMNALVMRDTPDAIEIARKILEANDIPDAELLLDVEIVEISKKNEDSFGLVLSRYAVQAAAASGNTLLSDTMVTPQASSTVLTSGSTQGTSTSSNVDNLLNLFVWRGFNGFFTVPSATFNFAKTLANGQTLANPRIRIKNREKSKFNVGTRVPITTTSSPVGGGVSVNVQYIDVGVKVNAEPTVQLNDDINIKLSLEVSSVLNRQTVGDSSSLTTVVTIGTRNLDTVLSLKDGETSIIGGLIQDNKSSSKQTATFIGDIPIIGPLLTGDNKTNDKNELVLTITPHIVRGITVPDADVASFWSGKEDDPSLISPYASFVQEPELPASLPAAPAPPAVPKTAAPSVGRPAQTPAAPGMPAAPASPSPPGMSGSPAPPGVPAIPGAQPMPGGNAAPAPQPVPVPPMPAVPEIPVPPDNPAVPDDTLNPTVPNAMASPPGAAALAGAAAPGPQKVSPAPVSGTVVSVSAPPSTGINQQFSVNVNVNGAVNLFSAPFVLIYDPAVLDFVGGNEGPFLKSDGKPVTFQVSNAKSSGQLKIALTRVGNVGGLKGGGTLASLIFRAKSRGAASMGVSAVNFADPGGKPIVAVLKNAIVNVQ